MKGMFVLGLVIGMILGAIFGVVIYAMIVASKIGNPGCVEDDREYWEREDYDDNYGYR